MINKDIFQQIYNELEKFLPSEWNKVVAYFEYGAASYTFEFYVKTSNGYIKCYDFPNINEDALFNAFKVIDKLLSSNRNNDDWTNMTMIVDGDGNMHADFDYTDLTDCAFQYMKDWKNKYLK